MCLPPRFQTLRMKLPGVKCDALCCTLGLYCLFCVVERCCEPCAIAQSCSTLCNLMAFTAHGILQATILEWAAMPSSRGIFPTQGLNPGLPHCRRVLHHQGSPHSRSSVCLSLPVSRFILPTFPPGNHTFVLYVYKSTSGFLMITFSILFTCLAALALRRGMWHLVS